jgi:hypothetical protein
MGKRSGDYDPVDAGPGDGPELRQRTKAAWGLWLLIVALALMTFVLVMLTRSAARPDWHPWPIAAAEPVAYIAYAFPGLVIIRSRPRNPIGWLLLVSGFGATLDSLAHAYALWALLQENETAPMAAWVSSWAFR